jgi:hypothetical protein
MRFGAGARVPMGAYLKWEAPEIEETSRAF